MTYECVIDTEIIKLNKMIGIKCFLFVITENVGVYLYWDRNTITYTRLFLPYCCNSN